MKLNKFVSICMYVFVVENRYLNCRTYYKNHVLFDKTNVKNNFLINNVASLRAAAPPRLIGVDISPAQC